MAWIFLVVVAQLIEAVVALLDKHIVTGNKTDKDESRSIVYAFYTCLISGVWVVVFLFGLIPMPTDWIKIPSISHVLRPTLEVVALAFLGAYTFFIALVSLFGALRRANAADVVPVVGAVSALASFGLAHFFLNTQMSPNFIWGIVLLATGTFLVSRYHFTAHVAMQAVHSGLFFACHYIAIKGLFTITTFDNGFFWSRIAFMLFALSLLLVPVYFDKIREQTKKADAHTSILVFGTKILAGISTVLILRATHLGEVAVVQALGGLQFVFILFISLLLGGKRVRICEGEHCTGREIFHKAIFVTIISLGFLVLFI